MLGKGLESLIPPSQGQGDNGQASQDGGAGDSRPAQGFGAAQPKWTTPQITPPDVSGKPTDNGSTRLTTSAPASSPQDEEVHGYVFHIEVAKIAPNPNQPRRNFDENGIRELANSIREFGFLQPLVVTRREVETAGGVNVNYELIAGERRLMAAKMLGLEVVPVIIRGVDREREKLELAIVENIQRENLNPVESARAFQRLQEEFRLTQREIAAKLGKSRESVANTMRLLDLPPYIKEALERGQITESHGRLLLAVPNPGTQQKLFDDIVNRGLTTREVRVRVKTDAVQPLPDISPAKGLSPELKIAEERLSSELGTPVRIEKGQNTGKITITFYSEEELEGILRKIGGGEDGGRI